MGDWSDKVRAPTRFPIDKYEHIINTPDQIEGNVSHFMKFFKKIVIIFEVKFSNLHLSSSIDRLLYFWKKMSLFEQNDFNADRRI